MSLLNGGISSIMRKAFAGIYLPATLYRVSLSYDAGGSPTSTTTQHSCRAQVDVATEAMRQAPGYTEKTCRVLVLADTLHVVPTTNDRIEVGGVAYNLMAVGTDPGNSYWDCSAERS